MNNDQDNNDAESLSSEQSEESNDSFFKTPVIHPINHSKQKKEKFKHAKLQKILKIKREYHKKNIQERPLNSSEFIASMNFVMFDVLRLNH